MKKIIYSFLFCLLGPSFLSACSCLDFDFFCEVVTENSHVIRGEIVNKYEVEGSNEYEPKFYMDVLIIENILGELTVDTISIVNSTTSCDLFHDGFEIGDEVILNSIDENRIDDLSGHPYVSPGGCSSLLLSLEQGIVTGTIRSDLNMQSFDDFKMSIGACSDLTALDRGIEELEKRLFVFPNPSPDNIFVVTDFRFNEKGSYELYDGVGQQVEKGEINFDGQSEINILNYPRGVYFLKIRIRDQFLVRKVLKN